MAEEVLILYSKWKFGGLSHSFKRNLVNGEHWKHKGIKSG